MSRDEARTLVWDGHATWEKGCRAIRYTRKGYDLRGKSCYPGVFSSEEVSRSYAFC